MDESTNRERKLTTRAAILVPLLISLIIFAVLVEHLFVKEIDHVGLSLVILAILPGLIPFFALYLESGEFFGQKFKFIRNIEAKVNHQNEIIQLIHEALKRVLTVHEKDHLEELNSEITIPCRCQYSLFLLNEMIRLCQHGFVKETPLGSVWNMEKVGQFNLKDFFQITKEGKEYLKKLDLLEKLINQNKCNPSS